MKECRKCHETKPLDAFNKRRSAVDGLQARCRSCISDHYVANREQVLARQAAQYAENRERIAIRHAAYHAESPHVSWEARYRRRANSYGHPPVVVSFTRADLMAHLGIAEWACMACGTTEGVELDHITPVSLGGPHAVENCRPLCKAHNREAWQAARMAAVA